MGFLDGTRTFRRKRCAALAALTLLGAACSFGWDDLDPRLGSILNSAEGGAGSGNEAGGTGATGGSAGNGGLGGAGGSGGTAAGPRDASVDTSADAAPDISPADVVSDAPPQVCVGTTCPICPAVVYMSACCKPNNGGCGCMVNIPPGPCM